MTLTQKFKKKQQVTIDNLDLKIKDIVLNSNPFSIRLSCEDPTFEIPISVTAEVSDEYFIANATMYQLEHYALGEEVKVEDRIYKRGLAGRERLVADKIKKVLDARPLEDKRSFYLIVVADEPGKPGSINKAFMYEPPAESAEPEKKIAAA